jgi:hypothetical protein
MKVSLERAGDGTRTHDILLGKQYDYENSNRAAYVWFTLPGWINHGRFTQFLLVSVGFQSDYTLYALPVTLLRQIARHSI